LLFQSKASCKLAAISATSYAFAKLAALNNLTWRRYLTGAA